MREAPAVLALVSRRLTAVRVLVAVVLPGESHIWEGSPLVAADARGAKHLFTSLNPPVIDLSLATALTRLRLECGGGSINAVSHACYRLGSCFNRPASGAGGFSRSAGSQNPRNGNGPELGTARGDR